MHRQSKESVNVATKCEITGKKKDESIVNYISNAFASTMLNYDNELYIINCKQVQIIFASINKFMVSNITENQ